MPRRARTTIAFIERHPTYFTEAGDALADLQKAMPEGSDPFYLVDEAGSWTAACVGVPAETRPRRWVQTRILAAGEYDQSDLNGVPALRIVRREDGRPPFLIDAREAPSGEGEYEPGGETFGIGTRLADHAGLRRIGVNIDLIRPGERSTKYHWHHEEEECFLILSGTGLLQVTGGTYRVGPGDFFAKVEGPDHAHQFINDGDADLRILTVGEHRGDTVEYPAAPWEPGQAMPDGELPPSGD